MIAYTVARHPAVEPDQHLQLSPAGGRRDAGAGARVRAVHRDRRARRRARLGAGARRSEFGEVVARISFFVNAGVRFVEEMCKMRAFVAAVGRAHARALRRRPIRSSAGSATACRSTRSGLTEAQPENNVQRIVLEMLAVTLSKDARARAVQLPAWNEALGLPRPWDQQWSLRIQQVLAFESDLLEYDDLFDGSPVVEAKVDRARRRRAGRDGDRVAGDGRRGRRGRERLPQVRAGRLARAAPGAGRVAARSVVVGVNAFTETEPNPLTGRPRRRHPDRRPRRRGSRPSRPLGEWRGAARRRGGRRRARPRSGRPPRRPTPT